MLSTLCFPAPCKWAGTPQVGVHIRKSIEREVLALRVESLQRHFYAADVAAHLLPSLGALKPLFVASSREDWLN